MKCRSCGYKLTPFFSLGKMPLANLFLQKNDIKQEKRFDLSIGFCPRCFLVQLMKTVSPENLFRNYIYFSSNSQTIVNHARMTAKHLTKRLQLSSKSLVVEIASNDGTQLQYFKKLGIRILGIDPAKNIADVANRKGIETIPEFFSNALAVKLLKTRKLKADLIYGANVLAHVPKIIDFANGVKIILKKKGTAVFEFPYFKGLLDNKFDTIYHEHVFYYSLISVVNLFQKADLEIYDVEQINMQGGSLRIFVSHPNSFKVKASINNLRDKELAAGFDKIGIYKQMNHRVNKLRRDLITLLNGLRKEGKSIAAYSAPAKGNTLLNYFGIRDYLDYIVDKAKEKQGLYTPGTHMRVFHPDKIIQQKPDYLLILCWNIADEVMAQLKDYHRRGGKFIIPIPEIQVI